MIKHLPNFLTLLRIALIPAFVVLMYNPSDWMIGVATVIFIIAALTDYADGVIARRYDVVSDFGKLLDPVADKILVMAALVMMVGLRAEPYGDSWVPAWMVVMILARETWITGLRSVAAKQGVVVAAGYLGKLKSFTQMLAIIILLLHDFISVPVGSVILTGLFVGQILLGVSIIFSYQSAIEYTIAILGKPKQ